MAQKIKNRQVYNPDAAAGDTLSKSEAEKDLRGDDREPRQNTATREGRMASDVKELHSTLNLNKDALKQIPIVDAGARLQQGSTYLDLRTPGREPFTATSEQRAGDDQLLVHKTEVPYEIWNALTGESKPGQDFEDSPSYRTR